VTQLLHLRRSVLFEHRLDREPLRLDDLVFALVRGRAVGDPPENLLLLLGAGPDPGLLAMVDRPALELVDDLVDPGPMARRGRVSAQRRALMISSSERASDQQNLMH